MGRATCHNGTCDALPGPEPIEPGTVAHLCTSGNNGAWSKGNGSSLGFTFERSENDHLAFGHFTGVLVDGNPVDGSNYTARSGSLILELKPSFLEGLSAGRHTVTALFDEGSAGAAFVVANKEGGSGANPSGKAASCGGARPTTGRASATTRSTRLPQTGDATPVGAMVVCACGLAALARRPTGAKEGLSWRNVRRVQGSRQHGRAVRGDARDACNTRPAANASGKSLPISRGGWCASLCNMDCRSA